ncbi:HK97 gp10 family phage protein [Streptomyces fractus]|uniref:HK97 gp10 family phage protein n=1 Tax=Streptomyces fractus TaxID=641806 RepID=UPI003CECCB70
MAYRSKYHGRYSGIGTMLSRPWLQKPCKDAAVRLKAAAEAHAPVGDPVEDNHSGRYKASFDVVPVVKNVPFRGKPRMRAGARLINTAPYAHILEYGNGVTPRYAVFRKSIDDLKAGHRG